jgi:putative transposase
MIQEQAHWAHQKRSDGRRSPGEVLDWVIGTPCDLTDLARLFAPVRYNRRLDRAGYVRFRRWRVYGERGLARCPQRQTVPHWFC